MRKTILLCTLLLATLLMPAVAATKADKADQPQGIHPWKQTPNLSDQTAHWSISLEGGLSLMDGDFKQKDMTIIPHTKIRPMGGIGVEYSFNPMWGLGLYYNYINYGVKLQEHKDDWTLFGHMHMGEIMVSFDLMDAWFPARKTDIFSLYFLAGGGLAFYNADYKDWETGETLHPRSDGKYDMTGVIGLGLHAEFNIAREWAIGLKGVYNIFIVDNIDAKEQGMNNDCIEYATLNLRWKINGNKKNHVRNYSSQRTLGLQRRAQKEAANPTTPQKDTVVIEHRDTIVIVEQSTARQAAANTTVVREDRPQTNIAYAYFEVDKAELNDNSLIAIQQIAHRLQEDTTLYVEVSGYCDNTGSEQYNERLGQKRAEAVTKELIEVYGISEDRFLPVSKGRVKNVKKAYGPNRRVEMRLTTKDDLQQLREQYRERKQRTAGETADSEWLDEVRVTGNATLSSLARRYYNNVNCWAYIYDSNRQTLKNPDMLREGMLLRIPRLTEEQMQIDGAEALRIAKP